MCTFNCRGLKSSVPEIINISKECDILLLQETWLLDFELPLLSNLCDGFYGKGISNIDSSCDVLRGRPHGGLAVLWKESISSKCNIVEMDDPRLMCIEYEMCNGQSLYIINVYLPYCVEGNHDDYLFYLNKIDTIVNGFDSSYVMVCGDFNAHVDKGITNHMFGRELKRFVTESELILSDVDFLPNNTYTYMSESHLTCSWLDHVLSTHSAHSIITDIQVRYNTVTSDHYPLLYVLDVTVLYLT